MVGLEHCFLAFDRQYTALLALAYMRQMCFCPINVYTSQGQTSILLGSLWGLSPSKHSTVASRSASQEEGDHYSLVHQEWQYGNGTGPVTLSLSTGEAGWEVSVEGVSGMETSEHSLRCTGQRGLGSDGLWQVPPGEHRKEGDTCI